MENNYEIKDIYQGGPDSLSPSYGDDFIGHRIPFSELSASTDARSANIVKEIGETISSGIKNIEVSQVMPEVFEAIPKQQFEELNKLIKLTGVKVTLHGPLIDASGLTQQGFTESGRESAERHIKSVIDRNQLLVPEGGNPITFHSANQLPGKIKPKKGEVEEIIVIDPESGETNRIPLKERHFPGEIERDEKIEIDKLNQNTWSNQLTNLGYNTIRADELIKQTGRHYAFIQDEKRKGIKPSSDYKEIENQFLIGKNYLSDSYRQLKILYDKAYTAADGNGSIKNKEILEELGKKIKENVNKINKNPEDLKNLNIMQDIIHEGLEHFNKMNTPNMFKPLKEFAKDKTTTTFGNAALHAYKKYGSKAPIVSIENPPVDSGSEFTTGEDIKNLVKESREKFVKEAVKEKILSESEAKKQAEKLIGATWDVGHINTLRKFGYDKKDILKETEKVAPFVKHVHLADNFGMKDSELPMGMGNVPIKEIMQKLGKEGYKGKKVIEAFQWWQHFSPGGKHTSPLNPTLAAFGSPMYSTGPGPYWNQSIGLHQDYLGGYGNINPGIHHQTFGSGFSQLPMELGGQVQGGQGSRVSGNPME